MVGTKFFPRYLEPFAPERIIEVVPGPKRLLRDPDVEQAAASVVKIRGGNDCGRGVEGSGFLYAQNRLMTNAHVVAGVDNPEVVIDDETLEADVVYYNPDVDVAVLAFDSGDTTSLAFDRSGPGRPLRSSATPRTAPTTSSPVGSAPSSGCAPRHLRQRHRHP